MEGAARSRTRSARSPTPSSTRGMSCGPTAARPRRTSGAGPSGGVYPAAHSEGRIDDPCTMQTQCLVQADGRTRVEVRIRFLHVVRRAVMRQGPEGLEAVDELTVGGERHLSWDEAVEREIVIGGLSLLELGTSSQEEIVSLRGRSESRSPGRRTSHPARSFELAPARGVTEIWPRALPVVWCGSPCGSTTRACTRAMTARRLSGRRSSRPIPRSGSRAGPSCR